MITFQNLVKFDKVSDITHVWKVVMSDHWRRFHKKKALKKGRDKETRGKDQSLGKETAQKRRVPQGGKATTKYQNLYQLLEAYQLKKERGQLK
jgi:hypothetical protein